MQNKSPVYLLLFPVLKQLRYQGENSEASPEAQLLTSKRSHLYLLITY